MLYQKDVEGPAGDIPVDQLNPEQLRRYKAWKRSRLERGPVREVSEENNPKTTGQCVFSYAPFALQPWCVSRRYICSPVPLYRQERQNRLLDTYEMG